MSDPLPLVLIGAGRVAHAVYLPLLTRPGQRFELVAVVEPDRVRASTVTDRYPGVRVEPDLGSALRRGDAHAAICATPWYTHLAVVRECLDRGLHVLCEKPVSLDPDEIEDLRAAERDTGRTVAVGYMKRHSPLVSGFIHRAARLGEARELAVRIVDPNAAHQIAHLVPPEVLRRGQPPGGASAIVERLTGDAPRAHREALAHGLGGSLVHQVNIAHTVLDQLGLDLTGNLVYATTWAGGSAVACGWRPREDLLVRLGHVRAPRHHRYTETIELVTGTSRLSLSLPSPYARDEAGELTFTEWDDTGRERVEVWRPPLAESAFDNQLSAWASMLDGTGPVLPGLAEAHRDAVVILQAVRSLV